MGEKLKIVIGYDGSDCARAALDDLRRAGLPEVAQAIVLSVAETSSQPLRVQSVESTGGKTDERAKTPGTRATFILEAAQGQALQAAERLQQLFPHWEISAESDWGSPASCILAKAGIRKADLIVVGSQGHSALGRFFLGSVSHTVVSEADCSVRVARCAVESASPLKLLVGIDGSEGADAALRAAASRHWPHGTKARVVTAFEQVVPPAVSKLLPMTVKWIDEDNEAERAHAQHLAETAAETLRQANLDASAFARVGAPKHVLLKEAEDWQAGCIVVGARGLNRLDRFLLGSVSFSVATRAHCSVEVIRPPARS